MASDRKGSEDEDVAGGTLCGWHRPSVQRRKGKKVFDNGVSSGRINASTPFEQGLTDSGCTTLTSMNANQPE